MKMTFLGVGSAFSNLNGSSNILVESGDVKLLVDCSFTCPGSLKQFGLSLKDVTHVLITHLHSDHISGLEQMAFMTKLVYKKAPVLLTTESLMERLWRNSLSGGLEYIEEKPGDSAAQTLCNFFTPRPVTPGKWFTLGEKPGLRARIHPTDHVKGVESHGLVLEENPGGREKRFFFSGDARFEQERIMEAVRSSALLFHDCQLFDFGKNNCCGVHTSYHQLKGLPAAARRCIWLYHYGDTPLPDAAGDGFAGFASVHQSFTF
ncbi:MAG: MBL fold metallo-hydrolase [Desulfobacterales bacterium]|nr:MBL fold metallo-hydrolase [Desulfobacterales bacterium]